MDKLRATLAEKVVKEERQAARDKQVGARRGVVWCAPYDHSSPTCCVALRLAASTDTDLPARPTLEAAASACGPLALCVHRVKPSACVTPRLANKRPRGCRPLLPRAQVYARLRSAFMAHRAELQGRSAAGGCTQQVHAVGCACEHVGSNRSTHTKLCGWYTQHTCVSPDFPHTPRPRLTPYPHTHPHSPTCAPPPHLAYTQPHVHATYTHSCHVHTYTHTHPLKLWSTPPPLSPPTQAPSQLQRASCARWRLWVCTRRSARA